MNELDEDLRQQLPPTDTRFRPDQRFVCLFFSRNSFISFFLLFFLVFSKQVKMILLKKKKLVLKKLNDHVRLLHGIPNGLNLMVIHLHLLGMKIHHMIIGKNVKNIGPVLNLFNYGRWNTNKAKNQIYDCAISIYILLTSHISFFDLMKLDFVKWRK